MEVRDYRCCMCPQVDKAEYICPTGPGKSEETTCDFVVTWTDSRGWKGMRQMKRRARFDEAQEELNCYAKQKGWIPVVR